MSSLPTGDDLTQPIIRRFVCNIKEIVILFALSSIVFMIYGWDIINDNGDYNNEVLCTGTMYNYVLGVSVYSTILFVLSAILLTIFFLNHYGNNTLAANVFRETWLMAVVLSLINLVLFINGVTVLSDAFSVCRATRFFNFL